MFVMMLSIIFTVGNPYQLVDHVNLVHDDIVISDVHREDYMVPYLDDSLVETSSYQSLEKKIGSIVFKAAKNAKINEQGEIVPAENGKQLDVKRFRDLFYTIFYQGGPHKIEVPVKNNYPRVDSELLETIRSNLIGQYTTYFNKNNQERSNNIDLSVKAINNHVIFPNEVFSFNEVVGKRTVEKGYLPAPVIVKGELAEDVGGGICQVSSTLFNAIDRAGITVVERYSHSRQVPYVPPGRDATVSWWDPNFSFQNNYNQPVLIRAKSIAGRVEIAIFTADRVQPNKKNVPQASEQLPNEIDVEKMSEQIKSINPFYSLYRYNKS